MGTILLIILILLLVGALPAWPYSSGWGYWPSGGLGLILLIIIILALTGHLIERRLLRRQKYAVASRALCATDTISFLALFGAASSLGVSLARGCDFIVRVRK